MINHVSADKKNQNRNVDKPEFPGRSSVRIRSLGRSPWRVENGLSVERSREFEKMLAKQKIRPQIPAKPAGLRKSRPSSSGTEIHYRTEQNNLNNQQEMVSTGSYEGHMGSLSGHF